jgi:hypothetical protein
MNGKVGLLRRHAAPGICFLVSAAIFLSTKSMTHIVYLLWQILPPQALREHPLQSLWYCHSQPPVISGIAAVCELLGSLFGVLPEVFATIIFLALSLAILMFYHWLAWEFTQSAAAAAVVPMILIADPSWYDSLSYIFYTPVVAAELGLAFILLLASLRSERRWPVFALALALVALVYTRTIWHPLFGVLFLLAAGMLSRRRREFLLALALFLALVLPWMIKNKVQFHQFNFTTWTGLNLGGSRTQTFIKSQEFDRDQLLQYYSEEQIAKYETIPALSIITKDPNLVPELRGLDTNLNHYAVPALSAMDARERTAYFRQNPGAYLKRCAEHFVSYDIPSFVNPYVLSLSNGFVGDDIGQVYGRYAAVHAFVYHGSWLEGIVSIPLGPVIFRPSHFIALLLPFALIAALLRLRHASRDPLNVLLLLMVFAYLWLMVIAILVDGRESARMRRETEPIYVVLLVSGIVWSWQRLRERKAASAAE